MCLWAAPKKPSRQFNGGSAPPTFRGVVGDCGVLGKAVAREVVVLRFSSWGIPPQATLPLVLGFLETSAAPTVNSVNLGGGGEGEKMEERTQ